MTESTSIPAPFFAPEEYLTDRVLLRSFCPGDGVELQTATLESYEHLKPWMPWATESQTTAEAEFLVRTFYASYLLNSDFVIAIRTPNDDQLIGGCGYHLREGDLSVRAAEMGMWIRASAAGHGFGTAALEALLDWGFSEWPWQRLSWRCDTRNAASARIAEKAGMRLEGTLRAHGRSPGGDLRDTACYAMLREEWSARRSESPPQS